MRYVALLRAINVGGSRRMKMKELRSVFTTIGLSDPVTLLQSGNVVFSPDSEDPEGLTAAIENAIGLAFGFDVEVVLRTGPDLEAIVADHPFRQEQLDDLRMAHVMFFKDPPPADRFSDLRAAHDGPEELVLQGRELYIHYPEGSGRSRLTGSSIEKALDRPGTARNWNTVLKIAESSAV